MKLTIPWLKKHLNTKASIDQIVRCFDEYWFRS